jgi:protein TonB
MKQKTFLLVFLILPLFSIGQNVADTTKVYDWVSIEQKPEYPGGEEKLMRFIAKNVHYPDTSKKYGVSGTVYVTFVINTMGQVDNVMVARGVAGGKDLDEEAVRVIKSMPAWKPGKINGEAVRVKYFIPIKFLLK